MTSLIAIGAGIAALTGIGAGIGLVWQHLRQLRQLQDSLRQRARSAKTFFLDAPLPKVLLFLVS